MNTVVKSWKHSDTMMYPTRDDLPDEEPNLYRSMQVLWPDWHEKANCLGIDDRIFFGSSLPAERPAYTLSEIKLAKSVCSTCPVFEQCLRQSFRNREVYGVWAGTTMKERLEWFKQIQNFKVAEEEVIGGVLDWHERTR